MNVFELMAKISLDSDEYENKLGQASEKTSSFGSKIGSALGTVAKVGGAALLATGAAITAMVKSSVDAYADYEQLVGGVETLFKESAGTVMSYAENAYKTAGLSANEYMETVTSFSASLLQSLGGDTEQAANYADMAITDMADNANKMGSSMESIQNAYQGFAKQNYTMLDNLKLGYGGTKSEMERLVEDAEKLNSNFKATRDENGNLTLSYADVVDAIHIVQTEMGITGTTAEEAASTISGSVAMAKSAWQNLLTGMANENADFEKLVDDLVDSVATAANNILPRVEQALLGISEVIAKLAPVIAEAIPPLVEEVVPSLLEAASSVLSSLVEGLLAAAPSLIDAAVGALNMFATFLVENVEMINESAGNIIQALISGIVSLLPTIIEAATSLLLSFVDGITQALPYLAAEALPMIKTLVDGLLNALPQLLDAAINIVMTLVDYIADNLDTIIEAAVEIIVALVTGIIKSLPKIVEAAVKIVFKLATSLIQNLPTLLSAGVELITSLGKAIFEAFSNIISSAKTWGSDLISNFISGITAMWDSLVSKVSGVAGVVKSFLGFSEPDEGPLSNFHTYAPDMMNLFMKGISDNEAKLRRQVAESFDFGDIITDIDASGVSVSGKASGTTGVGGVVNLYVDRMDESTVDYMLGRFDRELGWNLA